MGVPRESRRDAQVTSTKLQLATPHPVAFSGKRTTIIAREKMTAFNNNNEIIPPSVNIRYLIDLRIWDKKNHFPV